MNYENVFIIGIGVNLVKSFLTLIDFDNLFGMEFPFGYKYFKLFKEILKMKKVLIALFFASVLIYAKAEAHIFYVYSEDREEMEYVEAVENAFMRAGHQITKDGGYADFSVLVSIKEWIEDEL